MRLLLTISFTVYIWFCIGYYPKAFQCVILTKPVLSKKNQYLDYLKFVLNSGNSDEFNHTTIQNEKNEHRDTKTQRD